MTRTTDVAFGLPLNERKTETYRHAACQKWRCPTKNPEQARLHWQSQCRTGKQVRQMVLVCFSPGLDFHRVFAPPCCHDCALQQFTIVRKGRSGQGHAEPRSARRKTGIITSASSAAPRELILSCKCEML